RLVASRNAAGAPAVCTNALLATAYPDRVGLARRGHRGRYVLRAGVEVEIDEGSVVAGSEFVVVPELDGRRPVSRAFLASPIERQEVEALFADQLEYDDVLEWDDRADAVIARRRT